MLSFRERLKKGRIVFDGATGTQLQDAGLPAGGCPELWNIEEPEKVGKVHRLYVEAGSEVVTSNTFGGNRLKLKGYNIESRLAEINREGVRITRECSKKSHYVAASIGPTGDFLEPLGTVSEKDMLEIFKEQVQALLAGDPDLFLIETMIDAQEAKTALKAIRELTDKPAGVTMGFNLDRNGYRTMMGQDPSAVVKILDSVGPDFLGANCGNGPKEMLGLVEILKKETSKPLLIKPNAGVPQLIDGKTVFSVPCKEYVEDTVKLVQAGVMLIGGCCGTNPDYIRALATSVNKMK